MNIDKAIIYTYTDQLDQNDLPLEIEEETEYFLLKISRGFKVSTATSHTIMKENSPLQDMINVKYPFIEKTQALTKRWYAMLDQLDPDIKTYMIYAQVNRDDALFFECYFMKGKQAFVQDQKHIETISSALPSTLGGAFIAYSMNLESGELTVKAHADYHDIVEDFLDITILPNAKMAIRHIETMIDSISTKRDELSTSSTLTMKQFITDNTPFVESLMPKEILDRVFSVQNEEESNYISATLLHHHMKDPIDLKELNRTQTVKKHRILTESGIEILIPVDDIDLSDMLHIDEDEQGQTRITLKKVGKIKN